MDDPRQGNQTVYYHADRLQDLDARHGHLQSLEHNIVDLHGIQHKLAEIVRSDGEMIDNIEASVTQTQTQVVTASKFLSKTVDLQSAVRRKKIICGAIIFILITIAAIVITVIVVSKSK